MVVGQDVAVAADDEPGSGAGLPATADVDLHDAWQQPSCDAGHAVRRSINRTGRSGAERPVLVMDLRLVAVGDEISRHAASAATDEQSERDAGCEQSGAVAAALLVQPWLTHAVVARTHP